MQGDQSSSSQEAKGNPEHDYMFKLILLGKSGTGKSNILLRYTRNEFNEQLGITIGVQFATKIVETSRKKKVKLQIWDTVGQQAYNSVMKLFYKGTAAVLLTYDITSEASFDRVDFWYNEVKNHCKHEVIIMLIGNKLDLEKNRQVSKQKALEYAQSKKIAFYEVSAKDGTNIVTIFTKMAQELDKIMYEDQVRKSQLNPASQQTKSASGDKQTMKSPMKLKDQSKDGTQNGRNKNQANKKKCCS